MSFESRFNKELGLRLRAARKSANMTQQEVAARFNLSQDSISKYERGRSSVPASKLYQFSKLYEKPVSFFFMNSFSKSNTNNKNLE